MPLTWTQQSTPTTYNNVWRDLCYAPGFGLFVAVGSQNSGSDAHRVMTSPDGVTWTMRAAASATSWRAVAWAPTLGTSGRLVAVGASAVMTSDDGGVTWTSRTASEANLWYDVAWAPALTLFVAVAAAGTHRVMTSPDGVTWTNRTAAAARAWESVVWAEALGLFVAASVTGGHAMTSADGTSWTEQTAVFGAQSVTERGLAWSEDLGRLVAIQQNNDDPIWTSDTGTAWTQRTVPTTGGSRPVWSGAAWGAGQCVVVAAAGATNTNQIAVSADGVTWTESDPAVATVEPWHQVAWGADRFVALANNTNNDGLSVMTSPAPALTVTAIDPADGLSLGGTAVTITGTGFVDGAEVNFDHLAATDVVVVSPTSITCVTPAHVAGVVDVTVTLLPSGGYGTLVDAFEYLAYGIASVTPDHGPVTGDTAVTIAGLGFTVDADITFGGIAATDIVFVDETAYTCVTPAHTVGPVTVVVGDSEFAEAFTFEALDVEGPALPEDDETWTGLVRTDPAPSLSSSHHGISTLTFTTRESGEVPAGQIIGLDFGDGPVFRGPVVSTDLTFVLTDAELAQQHHAVDFAWDLNAIRPFGTWTDVSVSTIVAEMLAESAPDFTGSGVAAGLPEVTILFDGSAQFTECLTALCEAMGGGAFYLDERDLHLFQDPEAGTDPDVITADTASFLHDAPVTLTEDLTQLRTRIHGKGAGSSTRALALAGDTTLEVGSLENFESAGGSVLVGSQVVTYTGTAKVAEAARRAATAPTGPGGGMTLLPSLTGSAPYDNGNIRNLVAYKLSFVDERGRESALSEAQAITWSPQVAPVGGGAAVATTGGFMDFGHYSYVISYATAEGETNGAVWMSPYGITGNANGAVVFTDLVTNDDPRVLTIRIYRTKRGAFSPYYLVGEIPNTLPNTFTDVLNDASLTTPNFNIAPRTINTTGGTVYLSNIPPCPDPVAGGAVQPSFGPVAGGTSITVTGRGFIAGLNVYVGGTLATAITFIDETQYTCTVPAGTGIVDVTVGTAGDEASYLRVPDAYAYTDTDVRAKRIYRAEYDAVFGHWRNLFTAIATLTPSETTHVDDAATQPPGLNDSPLTLTEDAGTPVTDATGKTPPTWHYLLTGIPGSGEGAIVAPVLVNTAVNVWIQRDDVEAQAAFALRHGGTGVREGRVTDTTLRTAALIRRVEAELALWKDPIRTVKFPSRDPKLTVGGTVTFALVRPPIAGSFLIQTVGASLSPNLTTDPILSVTASSVRFTLEDLLRRVVLKDEDRGGGGSGSGTGASSSSSDGPDPAVWGDLGGTLSDQTDLVAALAVKASTTHAATHALAGSDPLSVLDLDGFPGGTTDFLRADGSFATPAGGGGAWSMARLLAGNSVDGSADVAFANKFLAQGVADAGLTGAQFLGALATGIVKNTTTTGVLSIAVAGDFPTLNQSTSGNALTATLAVAATVLATPRAINGVSFDGSAPITVTAAAGTLTGATLAATVLASSLTSVGVLATLTVTAPIAGSVTGSSGSTTGNAATATSAGKWTTARNLAGNSVDGSATVAFANKFVVQGTADAGLSAAQFLGALGTGIVKNTTTTGVLSIAVAGDFPTLNQNTTGSAASLSATLVATSGGTGQSVFAVGDLLYADTTTTLARRAAVAAGSYLRAAGVTTAPVWSTLILPNAITANQVVYGSATNTYGSSASLTFDGTTLAIAGNLTVTSTAGPGLVISKGNNQPVAFQVLGTAGNSQSLSMIADVLTYTQNDGLTVNISITQLGAVTIPGTLAVGAVTGSNKIVSTHATAGLGYATGAGGTVTQITSRTTTIILNKATGKITLFSVSQAADTTVVFTLTNSAIAATDLLAFSQIAGAIGSYNITAVCGAGTAQVSIRNVTPAAISEAPAFRFVVIKSVDA